MSDKPKQDEKDERLSIPLDPETALRALMKAGPHVEPRDENEGIDRPKSN
jgi:hypothetical protein